MGLGGRVPRGGMSGREVCFGSTLARFVASIGTTPPKTNMSPEK